MDRAATNVEKLPFPIGKRLSVLQIKRLGKTALRPARRSNPTYAQIVKCGISAEAQKEEMHGPEQTACGIHEGGRQTGDHKSRSWQGQCSRTLPSCMPLAHFWASTTRPLNPVVKPIFALEG